MGTHPRGDARWRGLEWISTKASDPISMAKGQSTASTLDQLSYLLLPWGKECPGACKRLNLLAAAPQEMLQVLRVLWP